MSNPILDDSSDYWKTIITFDKITAGIIILVGVFLIYNSINNWYSFHQTRELIIALLGFSGPEIVYPIRIMASLLICFYGIRLFLEEIQRRTAILLSIFTLLGINIMITFL
jgi:hypothetical protein